MKQHFYLLCILGVTLYCSDKSINPPEERRCQITDTTSHYIELTGHFLGTYFSNLDDVDAIDENNVWAVGNIDIIDGPEFEDYNAVKWDGEEFHLYHLKVRLSDPTIEVYQRLKALIAFSEDDIWMFSDAGSYVHWDGAEWTSAYISQRRGGIRRVWGEPDDFYAVGSNGSVTHYDGHSFELIESGTDKDLLDINGYIDPKTGKKHIWVVGGYSIFGEVVFYYNGAEWQQVWDWENPPIDTEYKYPRKIYIPEPGKLILSFTGPSGSILLCTNPFDFSDSEIMSYHNTYPWGIDGDGLNNIFLAGSDNKIEHFNGSTSKDISLQNSGYPFWDLEYVNGHIFAVGIVDGVGYFLRGKR